MNKVIGELLNDLRIEHKLTQQQLSEFSGIPLGTVKTILSCTTPNPGFTNVCALLTAMDESIDEFYCTLTDHVPTEKVPAMPEVVPVIQPVIQPVQPLIADEAKAVAVEAIHKTLSDDYVVNLRKDRNLWRNLFFLAASVVVTLSLFEQIICRM